jgi:hypothetical protein
MDISPSAVIFMTLLVGLSTFAYIYKTPEQKKKITKEAFTIKIQQPQQPPPTFVTDSKFQPRLETNILLPGAPFGSLADSSPLPYKDPVLERATLFQINGLLEDLRAFLGFEAKQLEDRSDPTVQLPLTKAKADFQRLKDEYSVLTANPGLQSQLTQKDLLDMRSGLRYLQREARQLKGSGAIPVGESGTAAEYGLSWLGTKEGFQDDNSSGTTTDQGPRATRDDLNETIVKIYAEMQRLSSSGTSDPVMQARLSALTSMRLDLQGLIQKLDSGVLQPQDIPVYKSDIQKLLPLLPNVNQPLPTILKSAGLSPILANILPVKAGSKESQFIADNQQAINSALDRLVKGLSWSVNLEYTSENKAAAGKAPQEYFSPNDQSLFETGVPSASELNATANPMGTTFKLSDMGSRGSRTFPMSLEEQRMDALKAASPQATQPGSFDWRGRAQQIRQSIQGRGLDPSDFGCLTPAQENSVSPDFSWRGYCKMICQRLQTTTDPGLPETCGCPPQGWLGWTK